MKRPPLLPLLISLLAPCAPAAAQDPPEPTPFSFAPRSLAWPGPRPGSFMGQSGGIIIVGGGLDPAGKPSREVFALRDGQWQKFTLRRPVAFSGFVSAGFDGVKGAPSRLLLVGGVGESGLTNRVESLEWSDGRLQDVELPPLPQAVALAGVGFFEDQALPQLYVVGGTTSERADSASHRAFRYRFAPEGGGQWDELPPQPGEGRLAPGVICFYNDVQVFGGFTIGEVAGHPGYTPTSLAQAYRWHVIDGTRTLGWRDLAPLPWPVGAPAVFETGQVHAAVAGGTSEPVAGPLLGSWSRLTGSRHLQVYHDVTDTWVRERDLPEALAAPAAFRSGRLLLAGTSAAGALTAFDVTVNHTLRGLRWPDYLGLAGYFALVGFFGLAFADRQKTSAGFALGNRKIPWWMAGISMFASAASSISFMAIPAQAFRTSLLWALPNLVLIPMFFLEAYVLYPMIRRLEITSTFEYLERRFHPSLRCMASAQSIALQTFGRMNMVLLLPALAIAAVTGLNVFVSVLIMGVLTTFYTAKGGIKAVVITETIQGLTMLVGITLIIVLAIAGLPHGFASFVDLGVGFHKFDLGIWSLDYTMPIFAILILTPLFNKLAFAADAPTVQRVFATPLKDMRKLAFIFMGLSVFIAFAVNLAGVSVFAYFHAHPAELDPAMSNDQVIPLYIVRRLPAGLAGLIIASLFAASMSALAGGMNNVAILFTEDFYLKFRRQAGDRERLRVMRCASLTAGAVATLCALYMAKLNLRSLFQTWNELIALLGGGFLGIYILGTYTRRANAVGAFTGAIASLGAAVALRRFTAVHWYAYAPGAVTACVVVGYLVSRLTPASPKNLAGLTIFDLGMVRPEPQNHHALL